VAAWSTVLPWAQQQLEKTRGHLFAWVPVFIGIGISVWFSAPFEPSAGAYTVLVLITLAAGLLRWFGPEILHPLAVGVACIMVGGLSAGYRAHIVAAPMLEFRFYGAVQGRVIEIDRSQSDALRLTLDHVVLQDVPNRRTPLKVRVSVKDQQYTPTPGQTVLLTAFLAAPEGPAEPGGFDFRRMAFFRQIGAVGYSHTPVLLWSEAPQGTQKIDRLRSWLGRKMMEAVPTEAGAFAAGAMTGDRSGIGLATVQALRDSNLAHLLAISGMNMAFLTGFVFLLVRHGVALVPPLALRVNSKKIAAVVAMGVALFYLLLSGANVATERAFLMVSVMLGAVLCERRALTMRSVAISAILLLMFVPESLGEPGFQLSFAATVVLVSGFSSLNRAILKEKLPRWLMPLFTMVLTSVLAGLATAPYAAATFNRFTDYGLLANLLTAPVMSILMASGATAALLAPVGLAGPALWVMEQAARWILFVAHWVASFDGAVTPVIQPAAWVMITITLAGIWAATWRGKWRLAAIFPMLIAAIGWVQTERPQVLISANGELVGILSPSGRTLSVPIGAGFIAENWLQADGDLADQKAAAARSGFVGDKASRQFTVNGWRGVALRGKGIEADFNSACDRFDIVIVPTKISLEGDKKRHCIVVGREFLDATGAVSLQFHDTFLDLMPTRKTQRIWMSDKPILEDLRIRKPRSLIASN
jgi:competence protein ComEC